MFLPCLLYVGIPQEANPKKEINVQGVYCKVLSGLICVKGREVWAEGEVEQ